MDGTPDQVLPSAARRPGHVHVDGEHEPRVMNRDAAMWTLLTERTSAAVARCRSASPIQHILGGVPLP